MVRKKRKEPLRVTVLQLVVQHTIVYLLSVFRMCYFHMKLYSDIVHLIPVI